MNTAIQKTRRWVESVIVGLNLCPFAAAPFRDGNLRFAISQVSDPHEILADLLHELSILDEDGGPRTTLLVLEQGPADFDGYLDLFATAEALLERTGHAERYQLVSFHPAYRFEGAPADDPANHTNRAPLPTIHILRRSDVAQAIASHPDVTSIPETNINLLRRLGLVGIQVALQAPLKKATPDA